MKKLIYFYTLALAAHAQLPADCPNINQYRDVFSRDQIEYSLNKILIKNEDLRGQMQTSRDRFDLWLNSQDKNERKIPFASVELNDLLRDRQGKMGPRGAAKFYKKGGQDPLKGLRVLLDPGHFGGDLKRIEARYVHFSDDNFERPHEGELSLLVSKRILALLSSLGADVALTKDRLGQGAIRLSFEEFLKDKNLVKEAIAAYVHKGGSRFKKNEKTGLEEDTWPAAEAWWQEQLQKLEGHKLSEIEDPGTPQELKTLLGKAFRIYNKLDISERAKHSEQIGTFKPHIFLSIHFNGDGDKTNGSDIKSTQNWVMAFVPGSFMSNEIADEEMACDFLRSLLTYNVWRDSVVLANNFVSNLSEISGVAKAPFNSDISYLQKASLPVGLRHLQPNYFGPKGIDGVFARNLDITQQGEGITLLGESFVQNNPEEAERLARKEIIIDGTETSWEVEKVAQAYFRAILDLYHVPGEKFAQTQLGWNLVRVNGN